MDFCFSYFSSSPIYKSITIKKGCNVDHESLESAKHEYIVHRKDIRFKLSSDDTDQLHSYSEVLKRWLCIPSVHTQCTKVPRAAYYTHVLVKFYFAALSLYPVWRDVDATYALPKQDAMWERDRLVEDELT